MEEKKQPPDYLEDFKAILQLAGLPYKKFHPILNKYWPEDPRYDSVRSRWFLVQTPYGLLEMGRRKKVFSFDWSDMEYRGKVTFDEQVTSEENFVHAWTYPKAVEYLGTLAAHLERFEKEKRQEKANG